MRLGELTTKFWTAAKYIRRRPDDPQEQAQRLLKAVGQYATGALEQRVKELVKDDDDTGTSYTG